MNSIKNAKIESTMLGVEAHGILTCYLTLNYADSSYQTFGGYALDEVIELNGEFSHREGSKLGMKFLEHTLKVVGVDTWEELKGNHIRVSINNGIIHAIGNLLEDKWLIPKELLKNQN